MLYVIALAGFTSEYPQASSDTVVILGDSLSAGYGLHADEGWVTLLTHRMVSSGYGQTIVNASVSGETTTGGLSRIPRLLNLHHPKVVVLELGANDALRGLPPQSIEDNLVAIGQLVLSSGARLLLVGAPLPTNYGIEYASSVSVAYRHAAHRLRASLVPSLIGGIETDEKNFQADHLHPVAAVQMQILDNIWLYLKPLLRKSSAAAGSSNGR